MESTSTTSASIIKLPVVALAPYPKVDRSAKLSFNTMLEVSDDQLLELIKLRGQELWLILAQSHVEVPRIDEKLPEGKRPASDSKLLRDALWRLYKHLGITEDFEVWRHFQMVKIIDRVKELYKEQLDD